MKPGDLVLTRDNLDPTGRNFIPYGTLCLVLGPAPRGRPEESDDARVMVRTATDMVVSLSKANLRSAYETR